MPWWTSPSRARRSPDADLVEQVDGALLEHAGAHPLLHVGAVAVFEDDRVDALPGSRWESTSPAGPAPTIHTCVSLTPYLLASDRIFHGRRSHDPYLPTFELASGPGIRRGVQLNQVAVGIKQNICVAPSPRGRGPRMIGMALSVEHLYDGVGVFHRQRDMADK